MNSHYSMLEQPSYPRKKQKPGCHLKAKVLPLQVTECLVNTVRQVTHLTTKPIVVEQNEFLSQVITFKLKNSS